MYVSAALYDLTLAVISSLRLYAIDPRNVLLPTAVFMLSLAPVAYDIFTGSSLVAVSAYPPVGCDLASDRSSNILVFVAVAMAMCSAADVIVVVSTWCKTYHTFRLARSVNISTPLSTVLLRDGTVYFGLVTVIFVLTIACSSIAVFNYFQLAFTSIILSRFFLNLRDAGVGTTSNTSSGFMESQSNVNTNMRGLHSLGGSVAFMGEDDDDQGADRDIDVNDDSFANEQLEGEYSMYGRGE
ncbi:hypothetical protein DAEQUDRAFT_732820 [Daedalea quercina L-15889]|uniref:Uncharacterized protein n=1 Tax=Daedalea quercina L-15889 TaxID=1314783 RepID=A0A165LEA8_9APHY|nr:hypothetical protein DAEQUDRAFT_732820 [Daedalea quercina L-15889]